ncbi:MAG: thermonuclease family protein [Acidiferrobacterales bacterium]
MYQPRRTAAHSYSHILRRLAVVWVGLAALVLLSCVGEARSKQATLDKRDLQPSAIRVLVGQVVRVVDGDTIYVLDESRSRHKIRLAGIDAPERKQPYGLASREHLASLVAAKSVTIEYAKHDRYGRIVGKVWIDGVDACLEQIKAGLAWHYKKYRREQDPGDRVLYAQAEIQARSQRIGLWQETNPKPPWKFRRLYRSRS